MTNPALLWNAPRPSPREPRPGERLWTLTKHGKQADAELREHRDVGCECQFFYEGELADGFGAREKRRSVRLMRSGENFRLSGGWSADRRC